MMGNRWLTGEEQDNGNGTGEGKVKGKGTNGWYGNGMVMG